MRRCGIVRELEAADYPAGRGPFNQTGVSGLIFATLSVSVCAASPKKPPAGAGGLRAAADTVSRADQVRMFGIVRNMCGMENGLRHNAESPGFRPGLRVGRPSRLPFPAESEISVSMFRGRGTVPSIAARFGG